MLFTPRFQRCPFFVLQRLKFRCEMFEIRNQRGTGGNQGRMCIWVHKHVFIRRLTYCKCVSPPRVGSCFASVFASWYNGHFLDPLKSSSCCPCEKKHRVLRGVGSNLQAHHRRLCPGKYMWNADTFEWCSHYKRLYWLGLVFACWWWTAVEFILDLTDGHDTDVLSKLRMK